MEKLIDWLATLKWYESVIVSGMLLLVGLVAITLLCVVIFKKLDAQNYGPEISEEELKRRRARAGFITATKPSQKWRGF